MKYYFDEFLLDSDQEALFRAGDETPLIPIHVRLLQVLVAAAPGVVTRNVLLNEVWQDVNISTQGLTTGISAIRDVLGDDFRKPRYIRTFRKKGFGFLRPVRRSTSASKRPTSQEPDLSLQDRLCAWGLPANELLRQESVLTRLKAKFVIDDIILESHFAGFEGVSAKRLAVEQTASDSPSLPTYVYEERRRLPRPTPNENKVFCDGWRSPIIDAGGTVTLAVGWHDSQVANNEYDYWTTKAVLKAMPRLHDDILNGRLALSDVGRRLDTAAVVVTADEQLVMAKRSNQVANAQGLWMTSIGEGVDPDLDLDDNGIPHPVQAIRRCLREYDELNLSAPHARDARIQILGIATEWQYLYTNVLALVELRGVSFRRLQDRGSDGEHERFAAVPFTLDRCLPLVRTGFYEDPSGAHGAALEPLSRVALLMSLMSRFGFDDVDGRIG